MIVGVAVALVVATTAVPAAACAVRASAIVGAWSDTAASADRSDMFPDGDAFEIDLGVEEGRRVYRNYLHHRPDADGRWSDSHCRLTLRSATGPAEHFVVVAASRSRLVLRETGQRALRRFRRIGDAAVPIGDGGVDRVRRRR